MNFAHRSYIKELLDGDDIPFNAIQQNMHELNVINTLLGGHAITIKGVEKLRAPNKPLHICEIGCGGGDNLKAIAHWAGRKGLTVSFTGIDIKPECIAFAKANWPGGAVEWIASDYAAIKFSQPPDIIFSSLFCHHFSNDSLVLQLQWMQQNARLGFFINDLHRHAVAYYAIKWCTAAFSRSYLVKNDAPLSVARSFKKREWQLLFKRAGIPHYSIQWQWAFRYLVTCKNEY